MMDEPSNVDDQINESKVAFIESKTKEYFDYVMESFDKARTESAVVMQWIFGTVIGSLGAIGAIATAGFWQVAFGPAFTSLWASYIGIRLIRSMKSRELKPPGNLAECLNDMLSDGELKMRWREAKGLDQRICENNKAVTELALAVDTARERFAYVPAFFLCGIFCGYLCHWLHLGAQWLFQDR